jgi:uncharacterized protein YbjT (DUF2867 family)
MKTALIAGATGLIGKELVHKMLQSGQYNRIYLISRKPGGIVNEKIQEIIIDFEQIGKITLDNPVDEAFCTLGTTMKQAGSREKFRKVDLEYVTSFARLAKTSGAAKFLVISSMGANPKSAVFYNRIKGLAEEGLQNLGFKHLVILRPSLLLGKRPEPRLGEQMGAIFMKTFDFLIPDNYKTIEASRVAEKMLEMAGKAIEGVTVVESGEMIGN